MDPTTVIWIQGGALVVLTGICVFLINKTWDKKEKKEDATDIDLDAVRQKTDKNEEHISKFRGELGLLNNEIINKIGTINTIQVRIEKDVDSLRVEYRELNSFLREFVAKSGKF